MGKFSVFNIQREGDHINYLIPFYTSCVYALPVAFENEFILPQQRHNFPKRKRERETRENEKEKQAKILHVVEYSHKYLLSNIC